MGPFFVKIAKIFWAREKIPKHGSIFWAKSLNMGTFFTSKHGLGSRGPGGTPPSKPKSSTPPPGFKLLHVSVVWYNRGAVIILSRTTRVSCYTQRKKNDSLLLYQATGTQIGLKKIPLFSSNKQLGKMMTFIHIKCWNVNQTYLCWLCFNLHNKSPSQRKCASRKNVHERAHFWATSFHTLIKIQAIHYYLL